MPGSPTRPRAARRYLRAWARVVGTAAARRALPVWAGVGVLAAIVMGGTGMHPEALTGAARGSVRFAVGLGATWLVLIVPAARAMLDPRATAWLRALPVARWRRAAVTGAIALAAQGPWALLWGAGEGPAAAAGAAVVGAGAALAVAAAAGRLRWPHRAPRWRGGLGALVGVHARLLARGRGAALVRAAGVAWLGGAAAGLVARANGLDDAETVWWALAVASVALPIAVGALGGPVVDGDRRLGWLLTASGCAWSARVLAAALALAGLGALLGVVAAAACWWVAGGPVALAGWLAVLGAGLGGVALRAGAWAAAGDDGTRVVIAMVGAAVGAVIAVGVLGPVGVVAVAAVGVSLAAAMASPRGRPAGAA